MLMMIGILETISKQNLILNNENWLGETFEYLIILPIYNTQILKTNMKIF